MYTRGEGWLNQNQRQASPEVCQYPWSSQERILTEMINHFSKVTNTVNMIHLRQTIFKNTQSS